MFALTYVPPRNSGPVDTPSIVPRVSSWGRQARETRMSALAAGHDRLLLRSIDRERDHIRGGDTPGRPLTFLVYGDFLYRYCRRLRQVLERLRRALGERIAYVFRHFPNERAHPGAVLIAASLGLDMRYQRLVSPPVEIGPTPAMLSLTVAEWCSKGSMPCGRTSWPRLPPRSQRPSLIALTSAYARALSRCRRARRWTRPMWRRS